MDFFTDIERHVDRLRGLLTGDADDLASAVGRLGDDDVAAVIRGAAALARTAEGLGIVASGVAARRSSREAGHGGLAQKRGHRNAVSLVQDLTGASRVDAAKHVRLGEAVLDAVTPPPDEPVLDVTGDDGVADRPDSASAADGAAPCEPWHASLGRALMAGALSSAQHDAILRGLGTPPAIPTTADACPCLTSRDEDAAFPAGCAAAGSAAAAAVLPATIESTGAPTSEDGAAACTTTAVIAANEAPDIVTTAVRTEAPTTDAAITVVSEGLGIESAAPGQCDRCDRCACGDPGTPGTAVCACAVAMNTVTADAWAVAAEQLADEAAHRTVEELARTARILRDRLDPAGAEQRFLARYQARSFRMWTDRDGIHHGSLTFDDHGAAWIRSLIDAALRPRRGGPRFVDPTEKTHADELKDDPRTNDQLAYDLILDVLRAGSLADAETVFGTRQAGIRLVTITHTTGTDTSSSNTDNDNGSGAHFGVSYLEDTGEILPAWLTARHACDTSTTPCTLDQAGNPLDLGREQRLFTPKQRLMLALRDGGCRWKGCDRPAHYCEAHHIDHYADGGRTDIDRGILLCAFHHMQLHHGGWRITRKGKGPFLLHPPDGSTPIELKPRLNLTCAWASIDPPPKRFRAAA